MMRKLLIASGYFAGAAVVVGGTILLIAYGNGYAYDFKQGKLIHKGLVLLESTPSGARINLGDKLIKEKTPYRQTFEGGGYDFTLSKDGYRTWHKRIDVIPSRVALAQYVILIPQHLEVESVSNFNSISQFVATRDRRRVAFVGVNGTDNAVWSLDTGNRNLTKLYAIPQPQPGQPAQTVEVQSWSDDSSHILIKAATGDQVSYLIVAANGTDPVINLTDTFHAAFDGLQFSLGNWRELYWLSPEGLRRVDVGNSTISTPLAEKVAAFTQAADRVIYVDSSGPAASLWSIDRSGRKQQLVKALPASSHYAVAYSTYINVPQAVVLAVDSNSATLYSNIYSGDSISSKTFSANASSAIFNGDGRFILLSGPQYVATYDLEMDRTYIFPAINSAATGLSWFDNYHIQFNRDGQMVLSEFDGNYAIAVTRGTGLPPVNSQDDKWIYAVGQTSNGSAQIKAVKIRQ